jgi:histidine triad (HIT) family protein
MDKCLFCQIAHGDKEKLIWENDVAVAFADIHPKAPVHILVVPKAHIDCLDKLDNATLAGQLLMAVRTVARIAGVAGAYRVVINNGRHAGQVIDHLHLHILGGKKLED